jgi:hypothetical protein
MITQITELAKSHFNFVEPPLSVHSECCGIESTKDETPMMGYLDDMSFYVTATNGYAAKSSDELARLAALVFLHGVEAARRIVGYPVADSVFKLLTKE